MWMRHDFGPEPGDEESGFAILHTAHTGQRTNDPNTNHLTEVYLHDGGMWDEQFDRLVDWLNHIAPDGVIPALSDESTQPVLVTT